MLVSELFEGYADFKLARDDRHAEHEWRSGAQGEQLYALVTTAGKVIRPGLTSRAAQALQARPDLVKKYGRLLIKRSDH